MVPDARHHLGLITWISHLDTPPLFDVTYFVPPHEGTYFVVQVP
jgi:hypothetical protein